MNKSLLLVGMLVIGCQKTVVLSGNEGAHGGDTAQIVFKQAQTKSIEMLKGLRECALPYGTSNAVKEWTMLHRLDLIEDLQTTQHAWQQIGSGSCARTSLNRNSPIHLSYNLCQNISLPDALQILIHESVHHFGIDSEDFPTEVALAVSNASNSNCIPEMSEITWLDTNISKWSATARILHFEATSEGICFDFTSEQTWPVRKPFDSFESTGNYWVIANIEGMWLASTYEWIIPQLRCEEDTADTIADGTKRPEFSRDNFKWVPKPGELVGFMVSSMVRFNHSNGVQERSPIHWVRW